MSRNKILFLSLIVAVLLAAVLVQIKYQPHPELNYKPGNVALPERMHR